MDQDVNSRLEKAVAALRGALPSDIRDWISHSLFLCGSNVPAMEIQQMDMHAFRKNEARLKRDIVAVMHDILTYSAQLSQDEIDALQTGVEELTEAILCAATYYISIRDDPERDFP